MYISVRLPVRTALLQNLIGVIFRMSGVRLPVRTALLQNFQRFTARAGRCDYQSERHCSKTVVMAGDEHLCAITSQNGTAPKQPIRIPNNNLSAITSQNGTAPKPSPTASWSTAGAITSQNGTAPKHIDNRSQHVIKCDYQSERHCSKTTLCSIPRYPGAITSQNGTAPKPYPTCRDFARRAITSQNGTAPKP